MQMAYLLRRGKCFKEEPERLSQVYPLDYLKFILPKWRYMKDQSHGLALVLFYPIGTTVKTPITNLQVNSIQQHY